MPSVGRAAADLEADTLTSIPNPAEMVAPVGAPATPTADRRRSLDGNTCAPSCVICCEPMTAGLSAISCGHVFHRDCIMRWFPINPSCPTCKVEVITDRVHAPLRKQCFDIFFDICDNDSVGAATGPDPGDGATLQTAKATIADLLAQAAALSQERDGLLAQNEDLKEQVHSANTQTSELRHQIDGAKRLSSRVNRLERDLKVSVSSYKYSRMH